MLAEDVRDGRLFGRDALKKIVHVACDRIKFARGSADAASRSGLLDAAEAFLRHGRLDSAPTQTEPPAEGGGR